MGVWLLVSLVAAVLGASFLACIPVAVVVHELGHAMVARLVGFRVLRIVFGGGKPLLERRWRGVSVVLGRSPFGGRVEAVGDEPAGWRWRYVLFCAGGVLANLLMATGLGVLAATVRGGALFYPLIVANALLLVNLLPVDDRGSPHKKDGRRIFEALTRDAAFLRASWLGALEHEALTHMAAGRHAEARACATALFERAPESPVASLLLGLTAAAEGRWDEAVPAAHRASAAIAAGTPCSPGVRRSVGALLRIIAWRLLRAGVPTPDAPVEGPPSAYLMEARRAADAALALIADRADVLATCGEARLRTGSVDEGVALLETAWEMGAIAGSTATDADRIAVLDALAVGTAAQGRADRAARWRALADGIRGGRAAVAEV